MTPSRKMTLALLTGLAALAVTAVAPATAAPAGPLAASAGTAGIAEVLVHKVQDRRWRRNRHGNRFRERRRGFGHFYDGYYYAVPWWEDEYYDDEPVYDRDDGGYDEDHEDWCRRKYRSYRPRTNTWTDFDGNTRECVSPFS
jgi:hypothetical protein